MKHPEDDVRLSDGWGYVAESTRYKKHLATAVDDKVVSAS